MVLPVLAKTKTILYGGKMNNYKQKKSLIIKLFCIVSVCVCVLGNYHSSIADQINLPKDSNGWTIFTPSIDSRIVYVSPSGNDATCTSYLPSASEVGADPFIPVGAVLPCATLAAALKFTRSGYPDWILLERGGVYRQNIVRDSVHFGRSATEPALISAYGSTGALPSLRPNSGTRFWEMSFTTREYLAVANLEWYADTVDPAAPAYIGALTDSSTTIFIWTNSGAVKQGIMFEGNRFKKVSFNIQQGSALAFRDFTFRRNVMMDINNSAGGILAHVTDSLFEENIWDHNGWYDLTFPTAASGDRMRNHNVYLSPGDNTVFKNNITSRACNLGLKTQTDDYGNLVNNFEVENNLFVDNNIGLGLATNNGHIEYRFVNTTVKDNVMANLGETNASTQNVAWAITFDGLDGALFDGNLVTDTYPHANNFILTNEASTGHTEGWGNPPYKSRNVTFSSNIFRGSSAATDATIRLYGQMQWDSFTFQDNIFDLNGASKIINMFLYSDKGSCGIGLIETDTLWQDNTYYNSAKDTPIRWNNYNITSLTAAQWKAQEDVTASFAEPSYPNSFRSIKTYMGAQGEAESLDAFYTKIREQNRYNWDPKYTAPVINDWIRAGYFIINTIGTPQAFQLQIGSN
jgi:hypothetical protein